MYVACSCGHSHWGRLGAAGLLLTDPERTGVLLQERSAAVHQGGTWSVPGGAIDPGETVVDAALREAREEVGLDPSSVRVLGSFVGVEHPEWSYTYVMAEAPRPADPALLVNSWEATATRWVDLDEVGSLSLHPAMRAAWPRVRGNLRCPLRG